MFELSARRFAQATGVLLVLATALVALGVERLARGSATLGYALIVAGLVATVAAFTLRLEGDPRRTTLLFVTRDACPLCDEARIVLRHVQREAGFGLWEVDVDAAPELGAMYGDEVPVVVREGEAVLSMQVREGDVRALFGS